MNCLEMVPVAGCFTDAGGAQQSVIIHIIYERSDDPANPDMRAIGQAVTTADANQTPIDITGGTLAAGACPVGSPDVEWELLCDRLADGSSVQFMCRTLTTFNAAGVPSTTVANFAMDKTTPYVVQGGVEDCGTCPAVGVVGTITAWSDIQ